MERLVEGLEKHDIAYGNHFFVFNDLNIEDNFKRWFNVDRTCLSNSKRFLDTTSFTTFITNNSWEGQLGDMIL